MEDVTIEVALKNISELPEGSWRKEYWVNCVNDELIALRFAKLYEKANILEKRLNASLFASRQIIKEGE